MLWRRASNARGGRAGSLSQNAGDTDAPPNTGDGRFSAPSLRAHEGGLQPHELRCPLCNLRNG